MRACVCLISCVLLFTININIKQSFFKHRPMYENKKSKVKYELNNIHMSVLSKRQTDTIQIDASTVYVGSNRENLLKHLY